MGVRQMAPDENSSRWYPFDWPSIFINPTRPPIHEKPESPSVDQLIGSELAAPF